jgi:hypothetical protein
MDDNEWKPNEWQGRTKEQVKRNYTTFGYAMIFGVFCIVTVLIYCFLKFFNFI